MMTLVAIFVALLFLHSVVSGRLERTVVTPPIVFTTAGVLTFFLLRPEGNGHAGFEGFMTLAETGLVLLLFADASRTDLGVLKSIQSLPTRLLSAGMLLTLLLGAVAAVAVFPGLSLWEAGILAAILAPTDAGLGQIIVNSPRVPMKIRQALNVEAGLNDGLAVPFLLFFIALAGVDAADEHARLVRFIGEQLGLGVLVGLGIGLAGGWLQGAAHRRKWVAHSWSQLGVVALPLLCLLISDAVGASMFIAAFVAGLAVQIGFRDVARQSVEFTEGWGQLFNLSVFYLFGLLVARAGPDFQWTHALYALLSLTVVRMAPVAVSLIGTGLSRASTLFMGWFGPRGLASIVLGLVYLEHNGAQLAEPAIRLSVMATVMISIFAHGFSASPGMALYARTVGALPPGSPERTGSEPSAGANAH